jgi:hydroxylamine reductase (hybrid-cluster protein)
MSCNSCNNQSVSFSEVFEEKCPSYIPNVPNKESRCPKTFPVQNCIYTAQGLIVCNSKSKEIHNTTADIKLNINQPFYNQTITENYKYHLK